MNGMKMRNVQIIISGQPQYEFATQAPKKIIHGEVSPNIPKGFGYIISYKVKIRRKSFTFSEELKLYHGRCAYFRMSVEQLEAFLQMLEEGRASTT